MATVEEVAKLREAWFKATDEYLETPAGHPLKEERGKKADAICFKYFAAKNAPSDEGT